MWRRDQEMRKKELEEWDDSLIVENTKKLQEIVEEIGWPTTSLVGKEAAKQAWDIVGHVKPHSAFHSRCLTLMKECSEGEIKSSLIANFEDQIRISDGKSQLYGTQFRQNTDGHFEPFPIEDIERLDERRMKMGLESFKTFRGKLKKQGVMIAL